MGPVGLALDVLVQVLDHDYGRIDHRADRDRDSAQAHDVSVDPEPANQSQCDEHAERQRGQSDQRAACVQQEQRAYKAHDDRFLDQRAPQRLDRAVNQVRAVVGRNDAHASR